jgi:succinate dehydrogenase/fumarate reductase flavoprotein subunit
VKSKLAVLGFGLAGCAAQIPVTQIPVDNHIKFTTNTGYICKTTIPGSSNLSAIAGMYAGHVEVTLWDGTVSTNGVYNENANPKAIEDACRNADIDSDGFVETREAENLLNRVTRVYASL